MRSRMVVLAGLFFGICALCAPVYAETEAAGGSNGGLGLAAILVVDPSEIYGKWEVVLTSGAAISNSGKKRSFSDRFYVMFEYPRYDGDWYNVEGKLYEQDKLADPVGGCFLSFGTRDNLLYFSLWFYEKKEYVSIYGSAYYLRIVNGKTAKVRMEGVFMLQAMEWSNEINEWKIVEIGGGSILLQDKD